MPRLSIAKEFLAGYSKLEKPVQKAVDKQISQFAQPGAGLNLEKLENAKDPNIRTIRITKSYRGVVLAPERGDEHFLIAVLPHDDANTFATNRKFTVNQALGVLELRDQSALETYEPALRSAAENADRRLFDHVKDNELIRLGVDPALLPLVRLFTSEAHLDALKTVLPEPQYDALAGLAVGWTPNQVWIQLSSSILADDVPAEVDVDDLGAAAERTPDKYVRVSGPDELASILANPFDTWRVFLHRSQRAVSYREVFWGPALVKGGAGTGKTVTAVHRAAYLAQQQRLETRGVLLTTFTRALSEALDEQLKLVADNDVRNRIDVSNVDKLAHRIVRTETGQSPDIIDQYELDRMWKSAADNIDNVFSPAFLRREWQDVILPQRIDNVDSYIASRRRGRLRRIGPAQKKRVWSAVSEVLAELSRLGKCTHLQVAEQAAGILAKQEHPPYQHVLVDEGQDLHPAQWRLLRAAVPEGANDMFIVSDPNQRIYPHQVSLHRMGIEVRGRSHTLKISYRTTQEILRWSLGVLGREPRAGLDDDPDTLEGYSSPMHGRRPSIKDYSNWQAELDGLIEQVQEWLRAGIEPSAIGIAARTNSRVGDVGSALDQAGIEHSRKASADAVRVTTMHSMKGLEFSCTAVVGIDEGDIPLPVAITTPDEDPGAHKLDTQRERCLLFVACTRARDMLYLSHSGAPSAFIAG